MISAQTEYLKQLQQVAASNNHRAAVVLDGDRAWQRQLLSAHLSSQPGIRVSKLGGDAVAGEQALDFKAGQQLLGTETDLLIVDDADGFDANSLTAACGALVGGGLLLLLLSGHIRNTDWFARAFSGLYQLTPEGAVPALPVVNVPQSRAEPFADQRQAVDAVHHVVAGHRKRPLVITADRGRGKSAALGIAAAQIMAQRKLRILVTAPARKSVQPLFAHCQAGLKTVSLNRPNHIEAAGSSLAFIAPDELLQTQPECDLLYIDEAAAIPIPLLTALLERYHRVVLATTVHGYEGCGRGFTIKFRQWLETHRPGWRSVILNQPIRWAEQDPLERWLFDTFLLDADLSSLSDEALDHDAGLSLSVHSQAALHNQPRLLRDSFSLLVAAHYQTSPNDLLNLLQDSNTQLVTISRNKHLVACLLLHYEGEMSRELLSAVMRGERRPAGQLVAGTLAAQSLQPLAGSQRCVRIMRIAVHPDLQGKGIGSQALKLLSTCPQVSCDYLATSYGVTRELLRFWLRNGFTPLRLGAKRDQASGTHSIIMVRAVGDLEWSKQAAQRFPLQLLALLPETFATTDSALLSDLLSAAMAQSNLLPAQANTAMVAAYCSGAVSYESALYDLYHFCIERLGQHSLHPVIVAKILQRQGWQSVARQHSLTGRRQAESYLKQKLTLYLE